MSLAWKKPSAHLSEKEIMAEVYATVLSDISDEGHIVSYVLRVALNNTELC